VRAPDDRATLNEHHENLFGFVHAGIHALQRIFVGFGEGFSALGKAEAL
jgi:hypothetical protein